MIFTCHKANKMNCQSNRTILQRLIIGFNKGFFTPSLPQNILSLHNNPLIRIFRFIGGISTLCILTHKLDYLGNGILYLTILYLCFFIILLFTTYSFFIAYYRIRHIFKLIRNGAYDIHK